MTISELTNKLQKLRLQSLLEDLEVVIMDADTSWFLAIEDGDIKIVKNRVVISANYENEVK